MVSLQVHQNAVGERATDVHADVVHGSLLLASAVKAALAQAGAAVKAQRLRAMLPKVAARAVRVFTASIRPHCPPAGLANARWP